MSLKSQAFRLPKLAVAMPVEFPIDPQDFKANYPSLYATTYSAGEPIPNKIAAMDLAMMLAKVPCRNTRTGCTAATPATRTSTSSSLQDNLSILAGMMLRSQSYDGLPGLQIYGQPRTLFQGAHHLRGQIAVGGPQLAHGGQLVHGGQLALCNEQPAHVGQPFHSAQQSSLLALPPPVTDGPDSLGSTAPSELEVTGAPRLLKCGQGSVAVGPPHGLGSSLSGVNDMIAKMQQHLRPNEHAPDTQKVGSKAKKRAKVAKGKKHTKGASRAAGTRAKAAQGEKQASGNARAKAAQGKNQGAAGPLKRPAAAVIAGLGCSKCRYSQFGCARCKLLLAKHQQQHV